MRIFLPLGLKEQKMLQMVIFGIFQHFLTFYSINYWSVNGGVVRIINTWIDKEMNHQLEPNPPPTLHTLHCSMQPFWKSVAACIPNMVDDATYSLFSSKFFPRLRISHPLSRQLYFQLYLKLNWRGSMQQRRGIGCGENISWGAVIGALTWHAK